MKKINQEEILDISKNIAVNCKTKDEIEADERELTWENDFSYADEPECELFIAFDEAKLLW